jgi:hypothetical protein
LIDPSQTGAGPDKVIFDNLFSISSILEYMDVNELDGLLISFDQEKAFDRVEQVLKAMNLPVNFITWVGILYAIVCVLKKFCVVMCIWDMYASNIVITSNTRGQCFYN